MASIFVQKQPSVEEQDDSDSEKKRKLTKQKWVPLEIELPKGHGKYDTSPRRRNDAHSTTSDGDRDWRAEREKSNSAGRPSRPASAIPRGRGRNRGGRRAPFNRPANRMPSDPDYSDYPTDFVQVIKSIIMFFRAFSS